MKTVISVINESPLASSYILAHFQVFTVQSHATQLTTLCADERGYVNNTSSLFFSVSVIFVLDRFGSITTIREITPRSSEQTVVCSLGGPRERRKSSLHNVRACYREKIKNLSFCL